MRLFLIGKGNSQSSIPDGDDVFDLIQVDHAFLRWQGKYPCKFCNRMFYSDGNLQRHIDKMHSYGYDGPMKCSYCSYACSHGHELNSHLEIMHKFKCDTCQKTFSSFSGLKNHNRTMHGAEDLLHKCSICGKCFENVSRLELHERSHSDHRQFKCQHCGKDYKYKCTLQKHLKVCDGSN